MKADRKKVPNSEMDSGWKDVIEDFTEDFFQFYLPEMQREIDFSQDVKFLDKELNEILSDSDNVKREADRLLEVRLNNGKAEWILIHIEVQGCRDNSFAERMYVYNYRIFDKYRKKVVSIALLIDSSPSFRPDCFRTELFGCEVRFTYPVIKLLDFDRPDLEKDNSPFAIITRVQLAKIKSEREPDKRYSFRLNLTKELYSGEYSKEQIIRLYRFIDYVLKLPEPKALQFNKEMELFEKERTMPYISTTERMAREEGLLKGIRQGIQQGISEGIEQGRARGQLEKAQEDVLEVLEVRFGYVPFSVKEEVVCCNDLNRLNKALRHALLIASADEFEL
ncbi:MAG: transposase [Candidatus Electrothrix sp. AUS1_2]|nr:transposase [Candidatus Electrothrix sp. AUS1_2]